MGNHVCYHCAKGKLGCTDCCTSPFIEEDPGFWLTLSDVARIVKKTGKNPDEFCKLVEMKDNEDDDGDVDEKYGELLYLGDKVLFMKGKDNKCFFLTEKGCSIFNQRPMMCRIHPFWFKEEDGKIKITIEHEDELHDDDCYLTKTNYKEEDVEKLLNHMGENGTGMMSCIKQYIREMELHNKKKHDLDKKNILQTLKDNGYLENE